MPEVQSPSTSAASSDRDSGAGALTWPLPRHSAGGPPCHEAQQHIACLLAPGARNLQLGGASTSSKAQKRSRRRSAHVSPCAAACPACTVDPTQLAGASWLTARCCQWHGCSVSSGSDTDSSGRRRKRRRHRKEKGGTKQKSEGGSKRKSSKDRKRDRKKDRKKEKSRKGSPVQLSKVCLCA